MIHVWSRTFSAMRLKAFRWLWAGRQLTAWAWQIGHVAQGWLVYHLTGSALVLGWVDTGWSVATMLFGLVGGIVADRTEKRRLMVICQALLGVMPFIIAWLALAGRVPIWVLVLNSLLLGLLFSFVMPARDAYMADLVGRRALLNAMALSAMGMSLMGIMASTVGGALIDQAGPAPVFFLVATTYWLSAGIFLRLPGSNPSSPLGRSLRGEFVAGFRYVTGQPVLLAILGLELSRVLFLMPYSTFLPVFAADVFRQGALGLGLLSSASSLGGLLGSLLIASLGDYRHKGLLLLASGGVSALALLSFARSTSFHLALGCILILSLSNNAYMVTRSALMQDVSSQEMRGRMVGFWRLVWGMAPLGTLPAGWLADRFGAPLTVSVEAVLALLVLVVFAFVLPWLRKTE